jgi:NAD(P)-dependent dehydrogenase (short-subunit alcohol dehydrogenase family)
MPEQAAGQFTGRAAIVTGAGSGIGWAIALALAAQGAAVVVADIDPDAGGQAVAAIEAAGGRAALAVTDVGDGAQVAAMVSTALDRFGRLDILCNNAGVSGFNGGRLADIDEEHFDAVVRVNLKGVWLGMRHAIPVMVAAGGGCIVNTASTLGLVGLARSGTYSATKHGVVGLTKSAAIEYGLDGVRVNAVCPGGIETPIQGPFRATFTAEEWRARTERSYPATARYGNPEEVAAAVVFLCSDAASNIHGIALAVDGGYTAQ